MTENDIFVSAQGFESEPELDLISEMLEQESRRYSRRLSEEDEEMPL